MKAVDIPTKFPIPFGDSANLLYIHAVPVASQIGITDGAASLTDGFPPLTQTPPGAGGIPPDIKDFNGILEQVTAWARWQGAGGSIAYDATFQTAIGGYPKGCVLSSTPAGNFWISTADDNATNPDAAGAGWQRFSPLANDGTVLLPGMAFYLESSTGFYRPSAGKINLAILGVLALAMEAGTATWTGGWNATTFKSNSGDVASTANTWVTLFSAANSGLYLVLAAFGTTQLAACLIGNSGGASPVIFDQWTFGSGNMEFQFPSLGNSNLQARQNSGGQTIHWSCIRMDLPNL